METNTDLCIRAFRATDDPNTCIKFIKSHRHVLSIFGIENITTNTDDWMYNPAIFVVVVESLDREKLYGGARLQGADGITPLPIEEATGKMDPKIHNVVKYYSQFGACELSGLWNSKEVAGLGIGSLFPSRAAVAITEQLGFNVMFSLCAPVIVRFQKWMGGKQLTIVGNNGTFYYPKIDLLATAFYSDDMKFFSDALPREREKLLYIKQNPVHIAREKSPFQNLYVNVHYNLVIPSVNKEAFKLITKSSDNLINHLYC